MHRLGVGQWTADSLQYINQCNAMQRLGEASRQLQGKTRRGSNIIIQLGPIVPAAWNGSRERIQILLIIYTHNSRYSIRCIATYLPT